MAAVSMLLEQSQVHGITMEQIAECAGVSKITLYRRWPSKLALFVDALLLRMSERQPLNEEVPPLPAIADHLVRMAREFQGSTGALARTVVGECLVDPGMTDALREGYLGHRRAAAIRIIARGQRDGIFRAPGTAAERHDMLYGTIWYRFLFNIDQLNEKVVLGLMEVVLQPAANWRDGWKPPAKPRTVKAAS
ncbi:transcriptional regulator, TetR family [Belnapia rosea]|nr:transcriptional regulator, TetR family [Belnapia rosea]